MFVLIPMSWRQVYSVDPCDYQHVATGVGGAVSLLPGSSWRCHDHRSCSVVYPTPLTTGIRPFYVVYTIYVLNDR